MPVGRLLRSAKLPLLALAVLAIAACGDGSGGFEEEMRPLLFQQAQLAVDFDAVLDPIFEEISTVGDLITAAETFADQRQVIRQFYEKFVAIEAEWIALDPPSSAEAFHQRTMEMMGLRVNSTQNLMTVADNALVAGRLDTTMLSDAGREWSAALEIWPGILAEANSFNAGDLDD